MIPFVLDNQLKLRDMRTENTFKINQVKFTYGERKKEWSNFYGMFSQNLRFFPFHRHKVENNETTMQRNQSVHAHP